MTDSKNNEGVKLLLVKRIDEFLAGRCDFSLRDWADSLFTYQGPVQLLAARPVPHVSRDASTIFGQLHVFGLA